MPQRKLTLLALYMMLFLSSPVLACNTSTKVQVKSGGNQRHAARVLLASRLGLANQYQSRSLRHRETIGRKGYKCRKHDVPRGATSTPWKLLASLYSRDDAAGAIGGCYAEKQVRASGILLGRSCNKDPWRTLRQLYSY
jgi:hypothetical protein